MNAPGFTIDENLPEQARHKREKVRQALLKKSSCVKCGRVSCLSRQDLQLLYELYDAVFFAGQLGAARLDLTFSLSRRMSKTAGKTIYQPGRNSFEIRIALNLFLSYRQGKGSGLVCGIRSRDSLEALLLVFEHELCHVIERMLFASSSCKKDRFKKLAATIFGHSSSHHELNCGQAPAPNETSFKIGDSVSFAFKGSTYEGTINNINKRATVMVKSKHGDYRDQAGNSYNKYYVPLARLMNKKDQA